MAKGLLKQHYINELKEKKNKSINVEAVVKGDRPALNPGVAVD